MRMSDSVPPEEKLSAEDWLSRTQDAERRGEFLAAYDFASRGPTRARFSSRW